MKLNPGLVMLHGHEIPISRTFSWNDLLDYKKECGYRGYITGVYRDHNGNTTAEYLSERLYKQYNRAVESNNLRSQSFFIYSNQL
jgi:hypothetical protein